MLYLSNSRLRVGVDTTRGGAVSLLASSALPGQWTGRNLINTWDSGRLIQQSYYGCPDGSCWSDKAWRFNPVQVRGTAVCLQQCRVELGSTQSVGIPAGSPLPTCTDDAERHHSALPCQRMFVCLATCCFNCLLMAGRPGGLLAEPATQAALTRCRQ